LSRWQTPPAVDPGGVEEVATETPGPLGEALYDERLSELAGEPLDASTLGEAARAAAEAYGGRLSTLAAELGSDDWRTLFAELEKDHPPDREAVLTAYREEVERQRRFLSPYDLFPWPEEPIQVIANDSPIFRRYFSLAMYLEGRLAVTLEPPDGGDPDAVAGYLVNHCHVCIPPLVAHEVAPGHHVAYSAANLLLPEGMARLMAHRIHTVYHEGWGLYAEVLMLELGYYTTPAQRLGAVRLLYLRALRASIDADLHRGAISAQTAVERYREEAGLLTAAAEIEVARHLKDPGLKASYFIGLRQLLSLRRHQLGDGPFDGERDRVALGDFHRRLLGRPQPIPAIARERFDFPSGRPLFQGDSPY
ncbi:MAG: DUF885 family protein, partial [Acidobacteriota bacterium]